MYQIGWTNLNKVAKGVLTKLHVPSPQLSTRKKHLKIWGAEPKGQNSDTRKLKKIAEVSKFMKPKPPWLWVVTVSTWMKYQQLNSAWIEDTFGLVNSPTLNPPCLMTSLHSGPYTFPRANGFIVEVHVLSCGWPIAWGWFHQTQQPQ